MSTATQLMTADELIKLPRGHFRHELVKGELLTMSPAGEEHGAIVLNVAGPLWDYVKRKKLGTVYAAETGFKLESNPDTVLAPDVAFVSRERVGTISKKYREGAPDLVVEVISPADGRRKVEKKTRQWLELGARVVWVIDPQTRTVSIHRKYDELRLTSGKALLTDGDLLPGFQISLNEIFSLG